MKRYKLCWSGNAPFSVIEDEDGEWVSYEDVAALVAVLKPRAGQTLQQRAQEFMADLVRAEAHRDAFADAILGLKIACDAILEGDDK